MADDHTEGTEKRNELDRRRMLAGSAATAAAAALPQTATAQSGSGTVQIMAATYMDPDYLRTFNQKRYLPGSAGVGRVHDIVRTKFATRADLQWGLYQKDVEPDYTKWGTTPQKGKKAFDNWLDFMQDARDDLEKQPAKFNQPEKCINPFNTAVVADNLMEHLDEVIRIALWDHSDIPLTIDVNTKKKRHHALTTEWDVDWVNRKLNGLTIHVNCPDGGWQGYTWWPDRAQGAYITKMQAQWQVPPHPTNSSGQQIIFIFNGLESRSRRDRPGGILQPVLQWANGTWSVRSWYVQADFEPPDPLTLPDPNTAHDQSWLASEKYCYSKAVQGLRPGQTITGTIVGGPDAQGKFNYVCSLDVDGNPQRDTVLQLNDIRELVLPVCAVESYRVRPKFEDKDYPAGPITMTSIGLQINGYPLSPILWKRSRRPGHDYIAAPTADGAQIVFTLA